METVTVKAYGKINLGLDVTGRREDGYHLVKMILQTVDLYDEVSLEKVPADCLQGDRTGIYLDSGPDLPADPSNLAWKAAASVIAAKGLKEGVRICIKKRIPLAAGMAGGSADAAAVIKGMDELFGLGMEQEEKDRIALKLGADVPFCLRKGTYLSEGIGEELTALPAPPDAFVVLVKPKFGISTKWSYETLDSLEHPEHPDMDGVIRAIREGSLEKMCASLGNILEIPALMQHPEISEIKALLLEYDAEGSLMSGSGATVFGLFSDEDKAKTACDYFRKSVFGDQVCLTGFIHGEA